MTIIISESNAWNKESHFHHHTLFVLHKLSVSHLQESFKYGWTSAIRPTEYLYYPAAILLNILSVLKLISI